MGVLGRLRGKAGHQFLESTALFLDILRWTVLATIVGALVGGGTAFFVVTLRESIRFMGGFEYSLLTLPAGILLSTWVIAWLAPDAEGHGTEKVIEAVLNRSGHVQPRVAPVKLFATVVTIATGGSAGKEGPAAQIGATLSSLFADLFRLSDRDRRKLVICGISAGFASIFSTPVAGALFGVEVLYLGQILYEVLLPSFIAGMTSYQVFRMLGAASFFEPFSWEPVFSETLFLKVILAGVGFGLVSILFSEGLRMSHVAFSWLSRNLTVRAIVGGILLAGIGFAGGSQSLGLGMGTIEKVLHGQHVLWWLFLLKILTTSVTLGCGGSGGVITPIFLVGVAAGSTMGPFIGLDSGLCAQLGMVALVAGTTNAPIAASVMGLELFGSNFAPYGATACVVAFLMSGYRSVYPSQILARAKSEILVAPLNRPISMSVNVQVQFPTRRRLARFVRWAQNWIRGGPTIHG